MQIAVVTPLFPMSGEAYRGSPIYQTVVALQKHADVKVLCAVASYPPLIRPQYRYRRLEEGFQLPDVDVEYFEYRVLPVLSRPFNGRISGSHIYARLRDARFDVLLAYWIYPEGYGCIQVGRRLRKPVVLGARGSDLLRMGGAGTRRYIRNALLGADHVLTVSEDLRRKAVEIGATPEKVTTVRNGIDREIFHYRPQAEARDGFDFPPGARIILFVGWIAAAKGVSTLVAAFDRLAAQDPKLHLAIIGEGSTRLVQSAFPDRVRLPGPCGRAEVARWIAAADVMCLPSLSEGCPNVLVEASAVGCPIVASSVGGIPEIVSPETAILTRDHQPETLAAALRDALSRHWDRPAIAARSSRTWDDVAAETFEICRDSARSRRSAPSATPVAAVAPAIVKPRRKPRIAVVTPYFPIAEEPYRGHSAYQTLRCMKNDADIEVICPIAIYPKAKWLNPSGYRYRRADLTYSPADLNASYFEYLALPVVSRPFNGFTCARFLEPRLRAIKPDVILNYWVYPEGFAAVRVGRRLGVPVIVGSIGSDILRTGDPISLEFVRYTLNKATSVITVSENLRRNTISLGVPPERVTTVLNGCDRSVFHERDQAAARRETGVAHDAELLLYVGWLSPTKGLEELVDSARVLVARHPRLKVAIIGEGTYQTEMQERIAAAGLGERFVFLGRRSSAEVAQWMAACDVFVLPSHSEGCPNVIVESIASGRPVVATNVGGIPELVNEECALLIPPRDTAALTAALHDALERTWDHRGIAERLSRGWDDAARETFEVCCRAAGIPA